MKDHAPLSPANYETTDGSPGLVLLTGGTVALLIVVSLLAGSWVDRAHSDSKPAATRGADYRFEHGPAARTGVELDWMAQDRQVRERLETYGWINREAGVVRIPIERAMERMAATSTANQPPP